MDVVTFLIASGMVNFLADRLKKMVMKRGEKFVEGQAEERVVKPVVNAISERIFGRPVFKPKLKLEDVLSILQRCLKEQKEIILEERDIALLIRESLDAACAEISAVSRSVEGLQNLIVSESMRLRRWLSGELNALVLRLCEELRSEIQGYSSEDVASVFERIDDSFSRLLSLLTRLSREHGEISRKIDDGFSRLSREHGVIEEKLEDVLEAVVRRPVGVRLTYKDVRGDSSSFDRGDNVPKADDLNIIMRGRLTEMKYDLTRKVLNGEISPQEVVRYQTRYILARAVQLLIEEDIASLYRNKRTLPRGHKVGRCSERRTQKH